MKFKLHRDMTVATTKGHVIEFAKGVLTYVPPEAYNEVIAVGAIPEDELPEDDKAASDEPTDPAERQAAVFAAFEAIVLKNVREEFGASGSPTGKAVNAALGWGLPSQERLRYWNAFVEARGEAKAE